MDQGDGNGDEIVLETLDRAMRPEGDAARFIDKAGWSWEKLLLNEFGKKSKLPPEVEERARKEKAHALAKLYESRFSVLCGRAGTGKTVMLRVFLTGLEELEGQRPILLLAPTGRARMRLMDRTKRDDGRVRDAYTIHQFLMRHKIGDYPVLLPEL